MFRFSFQPKNDKDLERSVPTYMGLLCAFSAKLQTNRSVRKEIQILSYYCATRSHGSHNVSLRGTL